MKKPTAEPEIDRSLRTVFNDVADLYDEVRPGYPDELVKDVLAFSGIQPDGRILEIGCGPGKATVPFAQYGYRMLCLELGERLAAIAARNCRAYPGVEIRHTAFEDWEIEESAFDLAISGEAFHWIPPAVGYSKIAQALKDTGSAALFWILRPDPDTKIFRALEEVYAAVAPNLKKTEDLVTPEWLVNQIRTNFKNSKSFGEVMVRQYPWFETFTGERYIKLLNTQSAHRQLDKKTREALFGKILSVIERFGGTFIRPYTAILFHAGVKKKFLLTLTQRHNVN